MREQVHDADLDLLDELGLSIEQEEAATHTHRELRIISGFEEIAAFVEKYDRTPSLGGEDIFERLYAVRLQRLRDSTECRDLLKDLDTRGLLEADPLSWELSAVEEERPADDRELLSALGVGDEVEDLTHLRHVRSREEIQAAEEVAQRTPCDDFGVFKPLFEQIQQEIQQGARKTIPFQDNAGVNEGDLFILDGQKIYVAAMGEKFMTSYDRLDCRLRIIYDNGTESDLLLRSLQRALNKDKASRRITIPDFGPLFSSVAASEDQQTGHIYILRSLSDNPFIAENRSVIHKIGVTSGSVEKRIAGAAKDPTYLLAPVEVVETYKLANINPHKLEQLLHKFFASARLDLDLKDRFGFAVEPREWFLLPLPVIEEAVELLTKGVLPDYRYDTKTGNIVPAESGE